MSEQVRVGSLTGAGAAVNVELGWTPDFVIAWNATDGDIRYEWFNGMGAADALQITNHADTQLSLITSAGIDAYAGSTTAEKGFTLSSTICENAKVIRWAAFRNTP